MRIVIALALGLVLASPAVAQEPDTVEEIVVVARRSGAPLWEVTRGDSTVLLVGEIRGVPEATPWRPAGLETATARAQRVMIGVRARVSAADILRLLWRSRTLTRLPDGRTSADYLTPEQEARLAALEARYRQDYSRQSFLISGSDLLGDRLRFDRDTTDDAGDVVRRAARKADIPARPVGEVRGDEIVENLLSAPPERHAPCLDAAMAATEAGREGLIARGDAWTHFDVPAVMASPLEAALAICWPWGDPEMGVALRAQWVQAIDQALAEPGVTMAVAPLRILAEPGGVLDQIEASGLSIEGPEWKTAPGAATRH